MATLNLTPRKRSINWQMFIDQMIHEDYALLIGPEVMKPGGLSVDSWEKDIENQLRSCEDTRTIKDLYEDGSLKISGDEIAPSLKELLSTKCFKIVLTTVYHPFLEKFFDDIYGRDENGIPNYEICSYAAIDRRFTDLTFNPRFINSGDFKPTIVYLLGNMSDSKSDTLNDDATPYTKWRRERESRKIARTEIDFMGAITHWLTAAHQNKNLPTLLKRRKLLVLGGKYDDWAFRFLLFALKGFEYDTQNESIEDERETKSDISIPLDKELPSDINLKKFLEASKMSVNSSDIVLFIDEIMKQYQKFMEQAKEASLNRKIESTYDIFLSYASEDTVLANKLYRALTMKGLKVWMDYPMDEDPNLKVFEKYKPLIVNAITNSSTFVPLLTENTKQALEQDIHKGDSEKGRFFHRVEWQTAQKLNKPILPIAAGILSRNEVEKVGWSLSSPIFWPNQQTREDNEVQLGLLSDGVEVLYNKISNIKTL